MILKRELKAFLAHPGIPVGLGTITTEVERKQMKFRFSLTELPGNLPGQPKKYVIDAVADAADPGAWCRWNTIPLLELLITNLSRAYQLDEFSIQIRSLHLLTREMIQLLCQAFFT